jgi:hypothetical protein
MIYLDDNTKNNIEKTIRDTVKEKLLDGFQNRSYQSVATIEEMNIEYNLNEEKSNRNIILIGPITIHTRVFVNLKDNIGQTTNWLSLRVNSIEFSYDENSDSFILSDNQKIEIIDMTY